MSSAAFEAAREDRKLIQANYPNDGTVQIERWKYAPGLLSPDSQVVDRLSLCQSLRDDHDERTQAALADLGEFRHRRHGLAIWLTPQLRRDRNAIVAKKGG